MVKVDALGMACPKPVIETKKAIASLTKPDVIEVWVDNPTAVENVKGLAEDNGYKASSDKVADKQYKVTINVDVIKAINSTASSTCSCGCNDNTCSCDDNIVIAIGSNQMGNGEEQLGKNLLKAFIYAVTQSDKKPKAMLFYNSGAYTTCEGSLSLEDLENLKNQGVKILTCGTCLDFYGIKDKLKVGEVTNMYDIVTTMENASLVIRP